jgi:hypothetical protein
MALSTMRDPLAGGMMDPFNLISDIFPSTFAGTPHVPQFAPWRDIQGCIVRNYVLPRLNRSRNAWVSALKHRHVAFSQLRLAHAGWPYGGATTAPATTWGGGGFMESRTIPIDVIERDNEFVVRADIPGTLLNPCPGQFLPSSKHTAEAQS